MNEEYVNVNLGKGIKVRVHVKVDEVGKRVIAFTDKRVMPVVLELFQRKAKNAFSFVLFNEYIQKRLLLRQKYKVVIPYGIPEMQDIEQAKQFAVVCLQKKLQQCIRRRIDYISDILMNVYNSLQ